MVMMQEKKSKFKQYAIGGAVAVVILCFWVYFPLMQTSSMDSSVAPGSFFKTKTADVSSLGNDIPQEGAAPGYALSGEMLNNPLASGDYTASSLFQAGPEDESAPSAVPPVPLPGMSAASGAPGPAPSGAKAKLGSMPSITAGNSNTMTVGGSHDKFFGSGAAKAGNPPAPDQGLKNTAAQDKRNSLVAMLKKTEEKSAQAAKAYGAAAAAGAATSAFEKTAKGNQFNLNTEEEQASSSSGLALGEAAQDLKRNDPQLNQTKVSLPQPNQAKDDSKEAEEEMQRMILQMILQSVLGAAFSN